MCVVCDFNLVLGRQGGQVGIPPASFFSSIPPHQRAAASLGVPPPFFLPGLRASCPNQALFAHRPYRTTFGKGEKRHPPPLEVVRE